MDDDADDDVVSLLLFNTVKYLECVCKTNKVEASKWG